MIIDTSAIIAILRREPEREAFLAAMASEPARFISAATLLESSIVVDRTRKRELSRALDDFVEDLRLIEVDVTESRAHIARDAYRDYGKGSKHRANLNFGDCFSYALARETRRPLLFKGDDFNHTDVLVATPNSTAS